MGKTIIIDEAKEQKLIANIFESAFYPRAEQVIEVEDFLKKNFRKESRPTINDKTGYSKLKDIFVYFKNGVDLQEMDKEQLLKMLDDRFHKRIKNDDDRKRFLNQVVDDWCHHKIKDGILSVNKV